MLESMTPEKLLAVFALVAITFGAGLQVNREHLVVILKHGGLLVRALAANFVIVPIFGVLIAKLFRLPPQIATGFLLMAIAPGVPFILLGVRKKGGSLGLAVALALFLPLISLATVPLTAALVLPPGAEARLPFARFVVTLLLFQVVPLLAGMAITGRAPAVAAKLGRPVQLVLVVAVLALVALLVPDLVRSVATVYGSGGMLAMLCLVVLSLITGWLLGGPARETRRILGNGTALRNIGLCLLIATTNFAGSAVPATVLTYLLIQFVVTGIVGVYFKRTAQSVPA
jgi:BASS family bile acid:Na+ symporter